VTDVRKRLLIIEDEPHIVLGLRDALEFEGFEVASAATGRGGLAEALEHRPDAVLLDLMLPDMNGYQVCEQLRQQDRFLPIIMLTARSQEADKIRGLDVGADDYVTKPFSIGELVARIRALFRRTTRPADIQSFLVGEAMVNLTAHSIEFPSGKTLQLSFYEVELLRVLHGRLGQPVSRDELLDKVWGVTANPTNRTVDNFIVKLRKKLEAQPNRPEHILTVYGMGYKLVP
jgi:DNA-binding response OmpR family regulator